MIDCFSEWPPRSISHFSHLSLQIPSQRGEEYGQQEVKDFKIIMMMLVMFINAYNCWWWWCWWWWWCYQDSPWLCSREDPWHSNAGTASRHDDRWPHSNIKAIINITKSSLSSSWWGRTSSSPNYHDHDHHHHHPHHPHQVLFYSLMKYLDVWYILMIDYVAYHNYLITSLVSFILGFRVPCLVSSNECAWNCHCKTSRQDSGQLTEAAHACHPFPFLATLLALHVTPVSEWVSRS